MNQKATTLPFTLTRQYASTSKGHQNVLSSKGEYGGTGGLMNMKFWKV